MKYKAYSCLFIIAVSWFTFAHFAVAGDKIAVALEADGEEEFKTQVIAFAKSKLEQISDVTIVENDSDFVLDLHCFWASETKSCPKLFVIAVQFWKTTDYATLKSLQKEFRNSLERYNNFISWKYEQENPGLSESQKSKINDENTSYMIKLDKEFIHFIKGAFQFKITPAWKYIYLDTYSVFNVQRLCEKIVQDFQSNVLADFRKELDEYTRFIIQYELRSAGH